MSPIASKFYAGIDYDYRPESFWAVASTPFEIALRNVKGRQRRKLIGDHFPKGELDQLPDDLLKNSLDHETRTVWDRIHPTFMGGEYLPNCHRNEVEIARIELDSTTHDVMSLRARQTGSRIKYSLVDEYQADYQLPQLTSSKPFSLGELIRVLDLTEPSEVGEAAWYRFGFVLSFNQSSLECGGDLDQLKEFTRVVSDFYPDLELHYENAIAEWYQSLLTELSEED
jgi:hypothetical protein